MNTEWVQVGWGLWLRWVLATSVVPAVVLTAVWGPYLVSDDEGWAVVAFLLSGPLVLASILIAQTRVLRRHVSRAGWWALASTVVYVVVGALLFALGAAVAPAVGEVVKRANTSLVGLPAAVGAALVGFFGYGAITGGILVRRLRRRVPEESSPPQDVAEPKAGEQSVIEGPSLPQDAADPERGGKSVIMEADLTQNATETEGGILKRWSWALIVIGGLIPILFLIRQVIQDGPNAQQVVVVTATPVPPTATPAPPTATPIPPTITPEPWDARVSALAGNLREFPHLNSQIMHSLIGGAKVDLLAVSPDNKWVHAKTAAVEGNPILEGWLQVDKLVLNVSLDDLTVDAETVFVQPPTRTPGPTGTARPTELPLAERYVAHFLGRGFEYYSEQDQYMLNAGRGVLVIKVTDDSQIVGYAMIEPMNDEEVVLVRELLVEAGEFLDPGYGWKTIQTAFETIVTGITDNGTAWAQGREVQWHTLWLNGDTKMTIFTFPNIPTYIGTEIDG